MKLEKTRISTGEKLETERPSESSLMRGIQIRGPKCEEVNIEMGKWKRKLGKKMNSRRERKRRREIKGKKRFWFLVV